jgi:hypothetical protein
MGRMNPEEPVKSKKFVLFRNPISLIGIGIFAVCTAVGFSMMVGDFFTPRINPYSGIFTYLVLPALASLGIGIALLGFVISHYRRKKDKDWAPISLPKIDLNKKSHRGGAVAAVVVAINLIALTAYRSYHFSDSVEFCGLACHGVMLPEYTTYKNSPHARVACVECHVGPGLSGFIASKVSGSYQLYSVLFEKFHRPIETPVKNLRPAQETCENCHWPSKFFGAQQKSFAHFLSEEDNRQWNIQLLLKIGGGNPEEGDASGIHWHMNIKNKIEYIAADERRDVIPWVRSTDPNGKVTEYVSSESVLTPEELMKHPVRRMDCIDCHNRPSHIFTPPTFSVDRSMLTGKIDPKLPYIKRESIRVLSGSYKTTQEALDQIAKEIPAFYEKDYPAVYKEKRASILQSVQALQAIYSKTIFPEMNTDWRSHPNHLSHLMSDGCFRCHDGLHTSPSGKVITNDCNACHTILAQGPPDQASKLSLKSQNFIHPVDMGMDVTTMKCTSCHGTAGGS